MFLTIAASKGYISAVSDPTIDEIVITSPTEGEEFEGDLYVAFELQGDNAEINIKNLQEGDEFEGGLNVEFEITLS